MSAACDLRKDQDEKEAGHSKIKAWLAIYAARFGEKSSEEDITIIPYRNKWPLFQEYQQDCFALNEKAYEKSHFYDTFNKFAVELKISLTRNTGTFLTCTVCDASD